MNTPTTRAEPPTKSAVKRKMKDSSVIDIINLPDNIQLTKKILKTNVCRLCATYHESGPNLLPLFETYKGVIILSKIVNSLMVIEVVKNDGLPEVICKKCTDQLIAWYKMRITSIEVNRALEIEAQTLGSPDAVNSNNMRQITYHLVDLLDSSDDEDGTPAVRPSRLVVHRRLPAVVPLLPEALTPPPAVQARLLAARTPPPAEQPSPPAAQPSLSVQQPAPPVAQPSPPAAQPRLPLFTVTHRSDTPVTHLSFPVHGDVPARGQVLDIFFHGIMRNNLNLTQ